MSDHGGHIPTNREREIGREAIRRIREANPAIVTSPRDEEPQERKVDHDPELCAYCRGLECWVCDSIGRDLRHCTHDAPQRHGAPMPPSAASSVETSAEPSTVEEPEAPPMPEEEPPDGP